MALCFPWKCGLQTFSICLHWFLLTGNDKNWTLGFLIARICQEKTFPEVFCTQDVCWAKKNPPHAWIQTAGQKERERWYQHTPCETWLITRSDKNKSFSQNCQRGGRAPAEPPPFTWLLVRTWQKQRLKFFSALDKVAWESSNGFLGAFGTVPQSLKSKGSFHRLCVRK